jgi:tetratricopeptide (TPR) repeat protein
MTPPPVSSSPVFDAFLVALETRMQAAIASGLGTLQCRVHQGRLLVLLEEPTAAAETAQRRQRFAAMVTAVRQGLMETELPEGLTLQEGVLPVRLYLRQRGQTSPYAACNWRWQPDDAVDDLFAPPAAKAEAPPAPEPAGTLVLVPDAGADGGTEPERGELVFLPTAWDEGQPPGERETASPQSLRWLDWPQLQQRLQAGLAQLPWQRLGVMAASGLVVGSLAYGLSRPCVVGNCGRRQVAYDLSETAIAQLNQSPDGNEVAAAHDQLLEAVQLLAAVPTWSPHYDRVQADLNRYRAQLVDVDWILQAQTRALEAATKSQDPPHPIPQWVDIHLLWQRAIADLDRVPTDSPVAALAAEKRAEYEGNYATIGDRIETERTAEKHLNQALQAGQLATARLETAATRAAWEQAQMNWQMAVNALRRIPRGTLAYEDAAPLLKDYQVKLVETRTRVNREKAGDRAYQAATAAAKAAQAAEQQNQWTRAVGAWQQAVDNSQQVPPDTSLYEQAQVLENAYTGALERAQINLRQAVALQTLETDLQALCPLGGDRCTYTTANRQIKITLLSPYDQAVTQSIAPPSGQGTFTQPVTVMTATHELVQAIMQLGNRSQFPIELYDPQGGFIARYQPQYGGFMKR